MNNDALLGLAGQIQSGLEPWRSWSLHGSRPQCSFIIQLRLWVSTTQQDFQILPEPNSERKRNIDCPGTSASHVIVHVRSEFTVWNQNSVWSEPQTEQVDLGMHTITPVH